MRHLYLLIAPLTITLALVAACGETKVVPTSPTVVVVAPSPTVVVVAPSPTVIILEPTPTPTPSPQPSSSRENAVPRGQPLLVPRGWEIAVVDFRKGVDDPRVGLSEGNMIVTVRLSAVNVSAGDLARLFPVGLRLVGSAGTVYSQDATSILIEAPLALPVLQGGTADGQIGFVIPESETSLVLMIGEGTDARFFALEHR